MKKREQGPRLTPEEKEWKELQEIANGEWGYSELIVRLAKDQVERRKEEMAKQADLQDE